MGKTKSSHKTNKQTNTNPGLYTPALCNSVSYTPTSSNSASYSLRLERLAFGVFGILLSITTIAGTVLVNTKASADNPTSANASVNVSAACTLSGGSSYTDNLANGESKTFGPSTLTASCNDPDGYSIYTIGYSNDTYGNNSMVSSTGTNNIATNTSGDSSYWAMQATATGATIVNSFDSLHTVPDTYTKIASYPTITTGTINQSTLSPSYTVSISTTQPAGTYTGKVKYTLVHPNAAIPQTKYYMQDFTIGMCEVLANSSPITVYDRRDETPYKVQYLPDGNCWMLDNLALDPTSVDLATLQGNTNASDTTLGYLKNGGGTGQYPASGVSDAWTSSAQNSYVLPYINTASKNNTTTSYGAGSGKIGVYYNYCAASAGSYCYASGSGTGNATEDICPAGWRMPTGGGDYEATDNEYNNLATALGLTWDEDLGGYLGTTYQTALSTPLSGFFNSGLARRRGVLGYFWSSTRSTGRSMYSLYVDYDGTDPTDFLTRDLGLSMRCIASEQ